MGYGFVAVVELAQRQQQQPPEADADHATGHADQGDLDYWTNAYKIDYPSAIDPSYKLSALFEADAFPANLIIDTRTMRIVEVVSGVPDESFWSTFEEALLGTPQ